MASITALVRSTPLLPTSSSSVAPVPTVIPGVDPVVQDMHDTGRRTLWVVTVAMGLSSLVFYVLAARAPLPKRVFHTLIALTSTVSFIIYLAMSTGEGNVYSHTHLIRQHEHVPNIEQDFYRQIQVLRYVNWMITSPIFLINLALLSGLPGAHLLVAVAANIFMFATGLLGTFASHGAKRWVWFALSCISYLVMVYQTGVKGQKAAANRDAQTRRFFGSLAMVGLLVMALYLVTLAAGPLALRTRLDTEVILFAILDIFIQGLLGYWIIIAHDGSAGIALQMDGFWTHGIGNEGSIRIHDHEEGP